MEDALGLIEAEILGERDLPRMLRLAVLLGEQIGSVELRTWALRELRGYEGLRSDLPRYRRVPASLLYSGMVGVQSFKDEPIPHSIFPPSSLKGLEAAPVAHGVDEIADTIESMTTTAFTASFLCPAAELITVGISRYSRNPDLRINQVYWSVQRAGLIGVMSGVEATFIELIAKLRKASGSGTALPKPKEADRIVNIVVYGDWNQTASKGWRDRMKELPIGVIASVIAAIIVAVAVFLWERLS